MKLTFQNSAFPLLAVIVMAFVSSGISGGPFGTGSTSVVGTYGGVLHPGACGVIDPVSGNFTKLKCSEIDDYLTANPGAQDARNVSCAANSLGIFSVGVPETGTANGTFVMFAQGRVFDGTIQGTADPGLGTLSGILHATFDFTVTDPSKDPPTMTQVTAEANGSLTAKIQNRVAASSVGVTDARLNRHAGSFARRGVHTFEATSGDLLNSLSRNRLQAV